MSISEQLTRYELAQDILMSMIASRSAQIHEEQIKPVPNNWLIAKYEGERDKYLDEEDELLLQDTDNVERIIRLYGPILRAQSFATLEPTSSSQIHPGPLTNPTAQIASDLHDFPQFGQDDVQELAIEPMQPKIRWEVETCTDFTMQSDSPDPVLDEASRRYHLNQGIASGRIEGFEPDEEFLELVELVATSKISYDEAVRRLLARAAAEVAQQKS